MRIERIDFVSIPVRELPRARRFYGDVLGLPRGGPAPDEFDAGNVTLALWAPEADGEAFAASHAGVALRVPDVAAARSELQAPGRRVHRRDRRHRRLPHGVPARLGGQRAHPALAVRAVGVIRHRAG